MNILICDSHRSQSEIAKSIRESSQFSIVDVVGTGDECLKLKDKRSFDLVIVDANLPDMTGLELAERMLHKDPNLFIMMATETLTMETWRSCIKLKVKGLLKKPVQVNDVIRTLRINNITLSKVSQPVSQNKNHETTTAYSETVRRADPEREPPMPPAAAAIQSVPDQTPIQYQTYEREEPRFNPPQEPWTEKSFSSPDPVDNFRIEKPPNKNGATVVTSYSPKGGVGKTTVAINLALTYQVETDKKVCLVEIDRLSGNLVSMLSMAPSETITDLVRRGVFQDPKMLSEIMLDHPSTGLKVLPAPPMYSNDPELTAAETEEILDTLCEIFDIVIIDLGSLLSECAKVILRRSQHILLVSNLDIPTLEDCHRVPEAFYQEGIDLDNVYHVINKYKKVARHKKGTTANIETAKQLIPFVLHTLHEDAEVQNAVNDGQVVTLSKPKSKFVREIRNLANELIQFESRNAGGIWSRFKRLIGA